MSDGDVQRSHLIDGGPAVPRILNKLSFGLVGLVVAAAAGCAQKAPVVNIANDPSASQNGIVVSGRGEVSGAPDTVALSIGVSVKRPTAPAAIGDAASSATKLIDALKAAGVAEKDIQTANYSLNQEFISPNNAGPKPDGFRVSNTVVAKIRTMDSVGAVIDAATAAGGSDAQVQGVSFSLDDDTASLAAARDQAFADAKAKAEQFAKLSDRKLGKVVAINQTDTPSTPIATPLAAKAFDAAATPTPIQAGEVQTAVTVDVRWSFED
jgi:hypothetical protein